jgi:Outer membrane protein (porin)
LNAPSPGALLSRYWTTMKLLKFAPLAIAGALSSAAHAQSSVTLYGLISAGVGYATNQGGKNAWQALSGTNQNPRWGLKGVEDLGGGTTAIFQLENGFNVMTGTASQNGREFGRQAFVGLASKTRYVDLRPSVRHGARLRRPGDYREQRREHRRQRQRL